MDKPKCTELTQNELAEMQALIPERGVSRPERTRRNKLVRERLPNLRNGTVVILSLYYKHGLSFGELEFRLLHKKFTFEQLVDLLFALSFIHYSNRIQRIFSLTVSRLKELGPSVNYQKILEKYREYEKNLHVFSTLSKIIKKHPDHTD